MSDQPAYKEFKDAEPATPGEFYLGASSWHSYPSIYNIGHKVIDRIFSRPVIIEEKIDGSQFSFGWFPEKQEKDGLGLLIKSKGAFIHHGAPPKMFQSAVDTVISLRDAGRLVPNWTYRGEVLAKPKHNTLTYERVPRGNIIIYDVNPAHEAYLGIEARKKAADDLGLETVPVLYVGDLVQITELRKFLETVSILGGQKIEGVVIKPFNRDYFGEDKKLLMGKFVSEAFREAHSKEWGKANPGKGDIIAAIQADLCNPARWQKGVIHLKERDLLLGSPADIGPLIKEIQADIIKEEEESIKDALFKSFKDQILRGAIRGFPEWYKRTLLEASFEEGNLQKAAEIEVAAIIEDDKQ